MTHRLTPTDEALHAASVPELVELIRAEIDGSPARRITFSRFMELALAAPGLGYYARSDTRPAREGDFLTAPELHPFFGRCIGRQLEEVWRRLDRPDPFTVLEFGAGRGTLRDTARAGLAEEGSPLPEMLRWVGVDLPERFAEGHSAGGRAAELRTSPFAGVVLANEYLDALPVHRLQRVGDDVVEHWVTWQDGWFRNALGALSDPSLMDPLHAAGITLTDGQIADVSPAWAAAVAEMARHLRRGLILIIDYGHAAAELYSPRRMAGSLMAYRDHVAGGDPLDALGRQDLTAHVDLTAVQRAAAAAGPDELGSTTQAEFLVGLGLSDLLAAARERSGADPAGYVEARAAVGRFLDPRHLGGFRVLGFGRGLDSEPPLRGFAFHLAR